MLCVTLQVEAQTKTDPPLSLIHRYELPATIQGHFDHFAVDAQGKRLFGTAVEAKVLVVFDLATGKMKARLLKLEERDDKVLREQNSAPREDFPERLKEAGLAS